jgi:hypothetical protein
MLAFDRLARDARNAVYFSLWLPRGDSYSLSFATLVTDPEKNYEKNGKVVEAAKLVYVEYAFDSSRRVLTRSEKNFSQFSTGALGITRDIVGNLDSVSFRFYDGSVGSEAVDQFKGLFPALVEIEIAFENSVGNQRLKKLFDFPLQW